MCIYIYNQISNIDTNNKQIKIIDHILCPNLDIDFFGDLEILFTSLLVAGDADRL